MVEIVIFAHYFTGSNTVLKLMWELYHGLVAVMLIQRLLDKFPSCASIGTSHAPPSKHLFVIYLFSFPEWKQLTFPIGKMRERERENNLFQNICTFDYC